MKTSRAWSLFLAALLLAPWAGAAPRSFNFVFDGASFNNGATATGLITFDDALLNNSGDEFYVYDANGNDPGGAVVLGIQLAVAGALSGNGSFSASDFDRVEWRTNGTLNLDMQLVGQPTENFPWGTPYSLGGEFNLFGASPLAPTGVGPFQLAAASGESMLLVSMAPVTAVPEPAPLFMLCCGLTLLLLIKRSQLIK